MKMIATTYNARSAKPIVRVRIQLCATKMSKYKTKHVAKMRIASVSNSVGMMIGSPVIAAFKNHGNPRPNKMSNVFEPTALATAMSPMPSLATAIEPMASGTEVPAAKMIKPITTSGIPNKQWPIRPPASTAKYVNNPIHMQHKPNMEYKREGLFGMVASMSIMMGSYLHQPFSSSSSAVSAGSGGWATGRTGGGTGAPEFSPSLDGAGTTLASFKSILAPRRVKLWLLFLEPARPSASRPSGGTGSFA
mmetsp:Transcript_128971/g.373160  ORF Transcript_128971/g.373160 Transcript_128971/m.373160 type:complete len:249 (+) Transcript_128971:242-988(+)